jgi:tetratricopeptide (TPR) repeat protein
MDSDLSSKAVSAATCGNWKEAILLNKQILKENPKDVDALNRLARAYCESGKVKLAKATCQKVLKIDPVNHIAEKSLLKWKGLKGKGTLSGVTTAPEAFLEESGKTKIVELLHPGPSNILGQLDAGDEVKLIFHPHRVNVGTANDKYIGRLPDDLAARLRYLTEEGYAYRSSVKSICESEVKIFLREISRPEKHRESPSFPPEKIEYASFTPPELVHKNDGALLSSEEPSF